MSIDRVDLLRASATLTGIDFIRVEPNQTTLKAVLHHDSAGLAPGLAAALAALTAAQVSIVADGPVAPARVPLAPGSVPVLASLDGRAVLVLNTAAPGGFGPYRLHIQAACIDSYFNRVKFSFKANCESELDCQAEPRPCPAETPVDFPVDYRARDFWSFRQALMDFAAQRYPQWQDRVEADVGMMVLELLAALGDDLAYAQDRLARESTLATASQRRSLRHLARLMDYPLDDGSGAFTWADVTASAAVSVPAGTAFGDVQGQVVFEIGKGLRDQPLSIPPAPPVPLVSYAVDPARNQIPAYVWDENDTCLAAGATELTLTGHHAVRLQPEPLIDPIGRWVLLQTLPKQAEQIQRRRAVRLAAAVDDADPLTAAPITRIRWDEPTRHDMDLDTLVLRGNLLPATAGATRTERFWIGPGPTPDPTDPAPLPLRRRLSPALERVGADSVLCRPEPGSEEDLAARVKCLYSLPGSDTVPLTWLPVSTAEGPRMRPELKLVRDGDGDWSFLPSLVGEETAAATAKVFTLEDGFLRRVVGFEEPGRQTELADYASNDGATLRFGDNRFGLTPSEGSMFTVRYRLGNGSLGNVAADTLRQFVGAGPAGVEAINNPLAALGGRDPETADSIRIHAPQAWKEVSHRAVRNSDYETIAERLAWVQQAGAVQRWTGSWPTVFVTPDPHKEFGLSAAHRRELQALIERVRMAGREAKVMAPRYADLDLEIHLCVAPNAYRGEVKAAALRALFGAADQSGFFGPDAFRFGQSLHRAALIAALQRVPGVKAVEGLRVRRRGWFDWLDFVQADIRVAHDELVRVANDRELPECGAVRLVMEGGA